MKFLTSIIFLASMLSVLSRPAVAETFEEEGAISENEWHHFGPFYALGGEFIATLTGDGDADLYVLEGAQPGGSSYDCRPYESTTDENCVLSGPGMFFVSVNGWNSQSNYNLTINYEIDTDTDTDTGTDTGEATQEIVTEEAGQVSEDQWMHYGPFYNEAGDFTAVLTQDADGDLYVREGAQPTLSSYDCRPYKGGSNDEACVATGPGEYYVSVNGYDALTNYTLTISYNVIECVDMDDDGYGAGCELGEDEDDDNTLCWTQQGCTTCIDSDNDGHRGVCDVSDPDVDHCDDDVLNWTELGCETCVDIDGDGFGLNCDWGEDCDEYDDLVHVCVCIDEDSDGFGTYCDLGDDCDDGDLAINPNAEEQCDGVDNDCDGYTDEVAPQSCTLPTGAGTQYCLNGQWGICEANTSTLSCGPGTVEIEGLCYCEATEPACGNGIVDENEICDGSEVSCGNLAHVFSSGTAVCNADCTGFDTESCVLNPAFGCSIFPTRDCVSHLSYSPEGNPESVSVAGEFNDWSPVEMTRGIDGIWRYDIELSPGDYGHKYVVDGYWESEYPVDVSTMWSDGSEVRRLQVADCSQPLLQHIYSGTTDDGVMSVSVQFVRASDSAPIDPDSVVATVGNVPVVPQIDEIKGTIAIDVSGLSSGKHSVRIWAADSEGRRTENEPLFIPLWIEDEDFEWADAAMYSIQTDRFFDSDGVSQPIAGPADAFNYSGGDFEGVEQKLPYLQNLGINTIWLSPPYQNPDSAYNVIQADTVYQTGYEGNWPIDPFYPEDRFASANGDSQQQLRDLVDAAHAQGIRVVFDLVANHVHDNHPYFTQHPEWFSTNCICGHGCSWEEDRFDCWFEDFLPNWNYKNISATNQMVSDIVRLVKEYDVDGFNVQQPRFLEHSIVKTISSTLRQELDSGGSTEFYLFGTDPVGPYAQDQLKVYISDGELDAQMDYPLQWELKRAFNESASFVELDAALAQSEETYQTDAMILFLGNQNLSRFATEIAGNGSSTPMVWAEDTLALGSQEQREEILKKMSLAFCFLFTQQGVPVIYYGDEIGMAGNTSPDNHRSMIWDESGFSAQQFELRNNIEAIAQARQTSEALRRGNRLALVTEDDVYIYARVTEDRQISIIAMNKSDSAVSRTFSFPVQWNLGVTSLHDVIGGNSVNTGSNQLTIEIPAWSYSIYLE